MDGGPWWATVHGVAQSRTRLRRLSSSSSMSIKLVAPSNHLVLCCPLLLLPSIFPSIRVTGQSIGASASTAVLPMNIQLISFRIDWFDLLAVEETLKSVLQHHSLEASILWCSAFFMVQFSIFLFFICAVLNKSFDFCMMNLSRELNGTDIWVTVCVSHSVVSDSLWPHGLGPASFLHPWDFPGKKTGVGCHFLLQP